MWRRRVPFDPLYIILEIVGLQTLFYMCYVLVVLILDSTMKIPFTIHQIFNYAVLRFSTGIGTSSIIGLVIAAVCAGFGYVFVEGRSRKALDYLSTTLFVHLGLSTYICAFPRSLSWWITFFASWASSVTVGELMSGKMEMQTIILDKPGSKLSVL